MYRLSVDFTKCEGCMKCEVLLPKFRTVYGGILFISKTHLDDAEIRAAADLVKDGCEHGAIRFDMV